MKVNVELDNNINDIIILIKAKEINEQLNTITTYLNNIDNKNIIGYIDKEAYILEQNKIENIYSEGNNVFACSNNKTYKLKYKLYECEKILENTNFIRISNSELVNFNNVKNLDLKFSGTILITLNSGKKTYCSRRKIKYIKEKLNIK